MKIYIPNNIGFRIVSSNAIAKFKQDQAFDFYEIVKLKDTISASAKEIILLEYEQWFRWILKLEKIYLLISDENDKKSLIKNQITLLLKSEMDDIYETMSIYGKFFNRDLTDFINYIHRCSLETLINVINNTFETDDLGCSFSNIVFYISIYLQQILFSIQEIEGVLDKDNLKFSNKLYFSGWCKEVCLMSTSDSPVCPVAERAKYYMNLSKGTNKFVILNMTKGPICDGCINKIKAQDIDIVGIKNDHMIITD